MILRVFIVTIREGMVMEFEDFFRKIAIPQDHVSGLNSHLVLARYLCAFLD